MAKTKRDSFTFFRSYLEVADGLEGAEWAAFIRAVINYGLDGVEPNFKDKISRALFAGIRPNLAKGWTKFNNGKNGGAPEGNTNASKSASSTDEKQPKNNQKTTENKLKDNDNDNSNKTKEIEKINHQMQSSRSDDRKDDDSIDLSSSFDSRLLEKFANWCCAKHGYQNVFDKLNFDYFCYCNPGTEENLDFMLRYLHENIMQGGVDMETLQADSRAFLKEKARREKLGLPVVPCDWNESGMKELFAFFKLTDEDKQRFYDTDTSHQEDNALRWIADNCFNGEVTSKELRARLDDARREQALQKLAKIPTDKVTSTAVKAYAQIRGYTHIDANRIINADIHGSWMKYVDACERKGREQAEKEREEPQPPQEQGFIDF